MSYDTARKTVNALRVAGAIILLSVSYSAMAQIKTTQSYVELEWVYLKTEPSDILQAEKQFSFGVEREVAIVVCDQKGNLATQDLVVTDARGKPVAGSALQQVKVGSKQCVRTKLQKGGTLQSKKNTTLKMGKVD